MGKRIPVVIVQRLQANLPEDKMSPQDRDTPADEHKPNPQPSSVVDKHSPDKNKKQTTDGKEDYPSNIKVIGKFFQCVTSQSFFNGLVAVATALLTGITYFQYDVQKMERRAAVYLGRPDGEIGEFMPGEDVLRIVLYFRNGGGTTAQRTFIEVWPITTATDGPSVDLNFPAPDHHYIGPSIPPGSPLKKYIPYRDATREELDSGRKNLTIYGRITYIDVFGRHCETFMVAYAGKPLHQFGLTPDAYSVMFPDICESK